MFSNSGAVANDFLEESARLAASMMRLRDRLCGSPTDDVLLRELSRDVHTLQGILLLVDFPKLNERARQLQRAIGFVASGVAGSFERASGLVEEVVRGIEQIHEEAKPSVGMSARFEPRHVSNRRSTTKQTVLVVDDSSTVRRFVQHVLEEAGFRVVTAPTPATAVAAIGSSRPALILLDLSVAEQDGGMLLRWFAAEQLFRRIPVVVFSQAAEAVLRREAERLGAAGYLQKTGRAGDIVNAVSSRLR